MTPTPTQLEDLANLVSRAYGNINLFVTFVCTAGVFQLVAVYEDDLGPKQTYN